MVKKLQKQSFSIAERNNKKVNKIRGVKDLLL